MEKGSWEKLTFASTISPLDFNVVAAVSYSGAKLISAQLHFISSTELTSYNVHTLSDQLLAINS
jgi:hypothetical protein